MDEAVGGKLAEQSDADVICDAKSPVRQFLAASLSDQHLGQHC